MRCPLTLPIPAKRADSFMVVVDGPTFLILASNMFISTRSYSLPALRSIKTQVAAVQAGESRQGDADADVTPAAPTSTPTAHVALGRCKSASTNDNEVAFSAKLQQALAPALPVLQALRIPAEHLRRASLPTEWTVNLRSASIATASPTSPPPCGCAAANSQHAAEHCANEDISSVNALSSSPAPGAVDVVPPRQSLSGWLHNALYASPPVSIDAAAVSAGDSETIQQPQQQLSMRAAPATSTFYVTQLLAPDTPAGVTGGDELTASLPCSSTDTSPDCVTPSTQQYPSPWCCTTAGLGCLHLHGDDSLDIGACSSSSCTSSSDASPAYKHLHSSLAPPPTPMAHHNEPGLLHALADHDGLNTASASASETPNDVATEASAAAASDINQQGAGSSRRRTVSMGPVRVAGAAASLQAASSTNELPPHCHRHTSNRGSAVGHVGAQRPAVSFNVACSGPTSAAVSRLIYGAESYDRDIIITPPGSSSSAAQQPPGSSSGYEPDMDSDIDIGSACSEVCDDANDADCNDSDEEELAASRAAGSGIFYYTPEAATDCTTAEPAGAGIDDDDADVEDNMSWASDLTHSRGCSFVCVNPCFADDSAGRAEAVTSCGHAGAGAAGADADAVVAAATQLPSSRSKSKSRCRLAIMSQPRQPRVSEGGAWPSETSAAAAAVSTWLQSGSHAVSRAAGAACDGGDDGLLEFEVVVRLVSADMTTLTNRLVQRMQSAA